MFRLLVITLLLNAKTVVSQQLRFENISIDMGLSNSLVGNLIQDKQGFIWMATENGLNRFDGIRFKTYIPQPGTKNCIAGRNVRDVFEDSRGRLWISFNTGGLSLFNLTNESFSNFTYIEHNVRSLSNNTINKVFEDKDGVIWVGTQSGLNRYNEKEKDFDRIFVDSKAKIFAINSITSIAQDGNGNIWIGTGYGVFCVNKLGKNLKHFVLQTPVSGVYDTFRVNAVSALLIDSYKNLWVGTSGYGLFYFNTGNEQVHFRKVEAGLINENFGNISLIFETSNHSLIVCHSKSISILYSGNRKRLKFDQLLNASGNTNAFGEINYNNISEDSNQQIWLSLSSINNKLLTLIPDRKSGTYKLQQISTPYSDKTIRGHFIDRTRTLWLNVTRMGVLKCDLNAKPFHTIQKQPNIKSLNSNEVYSISGDNSGNIWVGTGLGLNKIEHRTGKIESINYLPKNIEINKGKMIGALYAKDNFLYIGFLDAQLIQLNLLNYAAHDYSYSPTKQFSNIGWSTRAIANVEDKLFFSSYSAGLLSLNLRNSNIEVFLNSMVPWRNEKKHLDPKNKISSNDINCLCPIGNDSLWIGTITSGLDLLDLRTNKFTNFIHNTGNRNSISDNEIKVIIPGSENGIWIGTGSGGINFYNPKSGKFTHYDISNGLPDNTVYGIIEEKGNLWVSTGKGISKLNLREKEFRNYTIEDGLQSNEFNSGAFYKSHNGTVYFGGINGLTYFDPDSITDNVFDATVTFTNLKIFDKTVNAGDTVDDDVIISNSINYTKSIVLSNKTNEFKLEFVALHFAAPTKNQYKYKLEGFDTEWKYTSSKSAWANYTRLPAGNYVFKVFATNNDGIWSKKGASIAITVLPPWYKTWWFKLLIWLILVISLISTYIVTIKKAERRNRILEQKVAARTHDLKQANEEILTQKEILEENNQLLENQKNEIEQYAQKLHQSDLAKIQLFTNISHELRTPLTLISGPAEMLLAMQHTLSWDQASQHIININKNTSFLNRLVNQLLDYRKVQEQKLHLNLQETDITMFLSDIELRYSSLALENKQHITFQYSQNHEKIWFDNDVLEIVFSNLISNAIKYSKSNSYTSVVVAIEDEDMKITIADNGYGISEKDLPNLFEPFTRFQTIKNSNFASSGLGLAFAKELILLHRGIIEVKSELGTGTEFRIRLSVNKSLFSNSEYKILPAPSEPSINTEKTVVPLIHESGEKNLILVVEDNDSLRQFVVNELSNYYKVESASNGKFGLERALTLQPDLIVSDIMMPEMDGIELCKNVKESDITNHIPFLFLTAKVTEMDQMEGLLSGADDYILKPFNINLLLLKIRNAIESRKLIHEKFKKLAQINIQEIELNSTDNQFITKINRIIDAQLDNAAFDADQLAQSAGMSASNLYRKLKAITGLSVNIYIRNFRVQRAAEMFKKGIFNISEVAFNVGFNGANYFSRSFSDVFKISPTEYIKQIKNIKN